MDISKCLGCMEAFRGYPCPNCGYDPKKEMVTEYALPAETILAGKYMIGKLLGQGGFGMTYIGWDLSLERKVAIKEYYPAGHVSRSPGTKRLTWYTGEQAQSVRWEGMQMFVKEARKMAKVDSIPNVVRVLEVFQENETAYIVMDFVEGQTLKNRLKKTGPMSWDEAKEIFLPAIRAMAAVHKQGIIHRDLSPDNLMLTKDGGVQILDMGAAKDLNINAGASSMQVAKTGFSPWEQYTQRGNSGTWTDVYAMAATIYYTLTGKVPPDAKDRMEEDNIVWNVPRLETLPPKALEALKKAMAVMAKDRTQTMEELEQELYSPQKTQKTEKKPESEKKTQKTEKKLESEKKTQKTEKQLVKKRRGILVAAVAAVLVCGIALGLWLNRKPEETASLEVPTEATAEADKVTITEPTTAPTTTPTTAPTTAPTTVPTTAPPPTEHQHTYSTDWETDSNYHWHGATCGHSEIRDKGAHQWDEGEVLTESTHTATGEKKYTCTVCGFQKTETLAKTSKHVFDQRVTEDRYLASAATYQSPARYYLSCVCGEKGTVTFNHGSSLGYAAAKALMDEGKYMQAMWAYTDLKDTANFNKAKELYIASQRGTIAGTEYYTIALRDNGQVVFAGWGVFQGQFGEWKDIVSISARQSDAVGLRSDGKVVVEGSNIHGISNAGSWSNIVAVAAGYSHIVGLKADGRVVAVGYNEDGQCDVSEWTDIVALSAGFSHTVGLKSNGTVVATGSGGCGELDVDGWTDIVAVAAGLSHTVGLKADGTVVAVGYDNYDSRCDVGEWTDIVAVAAGEYHTVGLKADGSVVAVGNNYSGECDVGEWTDIVAVAAGLRHTIGLKADGTMVAVGSNGYGICEVGDWTNIRLPGEAPSASTTAQTATYAEAQAFMDQGKYMQAMWAYTDLKDTTNFNKAKERYIESQRKTIAGDDDCTLFLQNDGTVEITGSISGQEKIEKWNDIVSVTSGCFHAVGLRSNGEVVAAGSNLYGQCNIESWNNEDIVAVIAGDYYTLGLRSNGTVVAVGMNDDGQCDVGEWTDIVALAAGFDHSVGLKADGTVVSIRSTAHSKTNVDKWENIVAVAAGLFHTVGLKADGTVVAVGSNGCGQCDVGEWTDIVAVAAGEEHTVGLKADGTVVAVGKNDKGQCDVSEWTNVVAVAAGEDCTMVSYLR